MITLDLLQDWRNYVDSRMREYGLNCDTLTTEEATLRFLDQRRRRVSAKARFVHESVELVIPDVHIEEYRMLRLAIEHGQDLTAYLSRRLDEYKPYDGALYEWDLHHLHFRTKELKDTKHIIFVRFTETDAYVLQTCTHGSSWSDKTLISILESNWPQLTAAGRLNGVGAEALTIQQRAKLRRINGNTPAPLNDGMGYMPGGITPSGFCLNDVTERDRAIQTLRSLETHIRENEAKFRESAKLNAGERFELKMILDEEGVWFHEPLKTIRIDLQTDFQFRLPK